MELFDRLRVALEKLPPNSRTHGSATGGTQVALPFFEAYFSNFIEGTEFEVDEAEAIVFRGAIPKERPRDAHDILGTFRVVSDESFMQKAPVSTEEFLRKLVQIHSDIMAGRPDKKPGMFKDVPNRAGSTDFVALELVLGTLQRGFELSRSLSTPFARATFLMFLVAEVHPFLDGSGRAARVCMNVELAAAREARIIIPTVYRNDYMGALKAITHNGRMEPLYRVLDFAQRYTASIDWSDIGVARRILERTNAFTDPATAELRGIYLQIPDAQMVSEARETTGEAQA